MKVSILLFLACLALFVNEGLGFGYADCYCSCLPSCKVVKHWYNAGNGYQQCYCTCDCPKDSNPPPVDDKPPSIPSPPVTKPPQTPTVPSPTTPSPPVNEPPPTPSEPKCVCPQIPKSSPRSPPPPTPKSPVPSPNPSHGRPWQNVPLCTSLMSQIGPCEAQGWQLYAFPRFNLGSFCCNVIQQVRDNCNPWLFYGVDLKQHCG